MLRACVQDPLTYMHRSSPESRQIHTEPHSTKRAVWLSLLAPIALVLEGGARRSSAQLTSHVQARDGGILPATSKGVKNKEMVHSFVHAKSLQNVLFSGSKIEFMLHYKFLKTSVLYWLIIFECVQLEFREELNAPRGNTKVATTGWQ